MENTVSEAKGVIRLTSELTAGFSQGFKAAQRKQFFY